ncbi:MAG: phosphomannomutase [Elusimicrobiota bacterium]
MLKPAFINYEPVPLRFGTSGLRGNVADMTDLEVYINTLGYLRCLAAAGAPNGAGAVALAGDLRPSTQRIMRAAARAIADAGLTPENLGPLPTPALTYYAMSRARPGIMVTGSHIPFSMNGIKYVKPAGEVLKADEPGILAAVAEARAAEYAKTAAQTIFTAAGELKPAEQQALPPAQAAAAEFYARRYLDVFPPGALQGMNILYYQHSAVGRNLLPSIIERLGCRVHRAGRSEAFIAIDTEDITAAQLETLQALLNAESEKRGVQYDALISTDGDFARPQVCGLERGTVKFFNGDLLGAVVAEYLKAGVAAVPVSANSAVAAHLASLGIETISTRIGSPYVIAAMQEAAPRCPGKAIVSWEANGGFLTGTDLSINGKTLKALPTRDALLPILAVLAAARQRNAALPALFSRLPKRYGKAGLLDNFPLETGRRILQRFSPAAPAQEAAAFRALEQFFSGEQGFGRVTAINTVDGLRIFFANGDIAHVRPSGNAPQLRIYANADTQARADEIVALCLREPAGILRQLESAVTQ